MLRSIVNQYLRIGHTWLESNLFRSPTCAGAVQVQNTGYRNCHFGIGSIPSQMERYRQRLQIGRRRVNAHLLLLHVDQQAVVAGARDIPRNGGFRHLHVDKLPVAERAVAVARNDVVGLTLQLDGNLQLADAQFAVPGIEVRILDRLFDLRHAADGRAGKRHLVGIEDIDLDRGYGHLHGAHFGHFVCGAARILRDDAERQREGLVYGHFPALVSPVVDLLGGVAPAEDAVVFARHDGGGRTEVVVQQVQFGRVGHQILVGHRTRGRPVEGQYRSRKVVFVQSDLGGGGGQLQSFPDRVAVVFVRVPFIGPLAECEKGQQRQVACKFYLFHNCFFRGC